jgi:hypothetical protein
MECAKTTPWRQRLSALSSGAAGISLLFSATIRCASTIWSACRNADIMCAALRSQNASKLPRKVYPSTAIAVSPSVAGGAAIADAWRRKAVSNAAGSTPRKIRRSPV